MDYGFKYQGKIFTPNNTMVDPTDNDARNAEIEKVNLKIWAEKPERFSGYVTLDPAWKPGLGTFHSGKDMVATWLGTKLGTVYRSRNDRRGMLYLRVQGTNGANYYGKCNHHWSQLINLFRKFKGK